MLYICLPRQPAGRWTEQYQQRGPGVQALLHFNTEWAARYGASVTHDLEAADLSHRDAGIIFMAVSDLVTNAAQRSAEHLEVALTSAPADYGSILNLTVLCRCGGRVEPGNIPADSSLMQLTRLVYGERGTLRVHDAGDGSHVFDLTWPTPTAPRPCHRGNRTPGVSTCLTRSPSI